MKKVALLFGGETEEVKLSAASVSHILELFKDDPQYKLQGFLLLDSGAWKEYTDYPERRKGRIYSSTESLFQDYTIDLFFNLFHDLTGIDGSLAAFAEKSGRPYLGNSVFADINGLDKVKSKELFKTLHIRTPDYLNFNRDELLSEDFLDTQKNLTYPVIVKPVNAGSSIGLFIARSEEEFIRQLKTQHIIFNEYLIEAYIEGKEYNITTYSSWGKNIKTLPVTSIDFPGDLFDQKIKDAGLYKALPSDLGSEIERKCIEIAKQIHSLFQISCWGRLDIILSPDKEIFVLEINTHPGMSCCSILTQQLAKENKTVRDFLIPFFEEKTFKTLSPFVHLFLEKTQDKTRDDSCLLKLAESIPEELGHNQLLYEITEQEINSPIDLSCYLNGNLSEKELGRYLSSLDIPEEWQSRLIELSRFKKKGWTGFWLEFDSRNVMFSRPNVFISLGRLTSVQTVRDIFSLLPVHLKINERIEDVLSLLNDKIYLKELGVMLPRNNGDCIKLCFLGLTLKDLQDWQQKLSLAISEDFNKLVKKIDDLTGKWALALDFFPDGTIKPAVEIQPEQSRQWKNVLSLLPLSEGSLVHQFKENKVHQSPLTSRVWPEQLRNKWNTNSQWTNHILYTGLNHVKIKEVDEKILVKYYLLQQPFFITSDGTYVKA